MGKNNKGKKSVFIEFAKGHKQVGRVVFEMYHDLAPYTAQYFTDLLCAKKRGYLGSTISRVVPNGYIIGGDLKDVPQSPVPDESFDRRHAHAGVLSICKNSQFTITLGEAKHFDGINVVIGQVISGMETIREIAKVPTELNERPRIPITIFSCGVVDNLDDDEDSNQKLSKVEIFESNLQNHDN